MILNNFYWAVWAIMMLDEADYTNPEAYTWTFLEGRCDLHERCVAEFGFGQI